jgi:hypothetical protein
MKKIFSSLLVMAVSILMSSTTFADPITHPVDYVCPNASSLGYFENYIAGFGTEILSRSTSNTIYFKSIKPLNNVPDSLVNYSNSGTSYDGPTGYVTCSFKSTNPTENDFDISYNITNGKGGQILSRTLNTIRILFFVGIKK